MPLRHHPS
jgi:PA14 domain